jgi:hypothetical protein
MIITVRTVMALIQVELSEKWLKILAYMAITFHWIMFSLKIMKIKKQEQVRYAAICRTIPR